MNQCEQRTATAPSAAQPRMSPIDRAFHETVLRLAKGIVGAYENWIQAHLK